MHDVSMPPEVYPAVDCRAQFGFIQGELLGPPPRVALFALRVRDGAPSTLYAGGTVRQLDTVHVDAADAGIFVDAAPLLERYRTLFGMIESVSLGVAESKDFIQRTIREM
ncbi:hypothetical protein [Streptomyces niveus]|uniref:hypothetical protein n=1 Tax=Streptomyces niveus TaxID=193462 RepID=UPI00342EC809